MFESHIYETSTWRINIRSSPVIFYQRNACSQNQGHFSTISICSWSEATDTVTNLNLKFENQMIHWKPVPLCLPGQRLFAAATDADQQSVTTFLADDPGDAGHVLNGIHEKHELHLFWGAHVEIVQVLERLVIAGSATEHEDRCTGKPLTHAEPYDYNHVCISAHQALDYRKCWGSVCM